MSDAIIVLGRGITPDGALSLASTANVQRAEERYEAGRAPSLVMSGKWSYRATETYARTEASAMKTYAVELGVPADAVVCEEESLDTLGNVYFTKKRIVEPAGWRELTVVAAEEHVTRVRYLCEKIYGPAYGWEFCAATQVLAPEQYQEEVRHESESLARSHEWLDDIQDGDDVAIWELVQLHHPAYKIA